MRAMSLKPHGAEKPLMHREDATLMLLHKEQPMYLINMQACLIMMMHYVMED